MAVEPVRRVHLPLRCEATGYLEAWREVTIHAELGGRVVERPVEEGSRVESGQLLVRLDDREQQIDLTQSEAEWLKAQASFAIDFERELAGDQKSSDAALPEAASDGQTDDLERMLRDGVISRQGYYRQRREQEAMKLLAGDRRSDVRAAINGLTQAEQVLERNRFDLERMSVSALFAGRVADILVAVGQAVSPGAPLLTLLEDERLKVEVDVLESDAVRLRPGAPALVRIPAADALMLTGTIHSINPRIDPQTGTGRVTVAIPNPRRLLLAGLFAVVELETGELENVLAVPAASVLSRQDRHLVFRVVEGRALWTYVDVGSRSGDLVEIVDGLREGELVAIADHFALSHEAPVKAIEGAAAP